MKLHVALFGAALVAVAATSARAIDLGVKSIAGTIKITRKGETTATTYKTGDHVPALQPGDSVSVIEGKATFAAGSFTLAAVEGGAFTFYNVKRILGIAVTGSTPISLSHGSLTATLHSGDAINTSAGLTVERGSVAVTDGAFTGTLKSGENLDSKMGLRSTENSVMIDHPTPPPAASPEQQKTVVSPSSPA